MTKRPLISCIVPVFNCERYLGGAIDSILGQTYRPLQVIVVDDGSTDGTAAVATRYGEQVQYLWQANAGAPAARNLGLSAVRGEFVAFLDADDLWHPEKLERQMARFEARPELDLSVTGGQYFWTTEGLERDPRSKDPRYTRPWSGFASTQALLARRNAFDVVGPFNTYLKLWDDREWFIRAAEHGLIRELLPQVLVRCRMHDANTTRRVTNGVAEMAKLHLVKASLDRRRRQS
jgi:glycosyltransferase involved in cell wall biosynthesis